MACKLSWFCLLLLGFALNACGSRGSLTVNQNRSGGGAAPNPWALPKLLGSTGIASPAYALTRTPDGASYIAGTTDGALAGQALSGASDALLAKFNDDGTLEWVRLLGGTNAADAKAVCADPFGGIYIAGKTDGIFDGHALLGSVQGFLAKYDAAGTLQWSRTMGGTISAEFRGCAT
ncbi:MAG: hypothetical protein EOP11_09180, partial [Proteobacteria bacterium]